MAFEYENYNYLTSIPSQFQAYVYQEYNDDDNIAAFFTAYNTISQQNLDLTNQLQLPIYYVQSGNLLNWTALGIYGQVRQDLPVGGPRPFGPINTWEANQEIPNYFHFVANSNSYAVSDLAFKQIIQWNTFKGDGYYFTLNWLKRRVIRFLAAGAFLYPDNTYQVSVSFTSDVDVLITLSPGFGTVSGGSFYNKQNFNQLNANFNEFTVEETSSVSLELAPILQAGILAGVLQTPFQYNFTVEIGE